MDAVAGRTHSPLIPGEPSPPITFGYLANHAVFTGVLAASNELPPSPRFFFGSMPPEVSATYFSRLMLPPVGVYQARNIALSTGFVLQTADSVLVAPQLNLQQSTVEEAIAEFGLPNAGQASKQLDGPHALITGPGYKIYGHWLADMLPRLAVLTAAGVDLEEVRLLVPDDMPAFAEEMLDLLGFDETRRVRFGGSAVSVAVDELLLPTFLHNGVRYSRILERSVMLLRERLERRHGSLSGGGYPKRVLIARTGKGQRALIDRERMEQECIAAGFTRVTPEVLPLIEQWRLFRGAREIIGEYGSALHGCIFSSPGTVVCGLRGSRFHPAFIQSGMGDVLEQPTGYVFGETIPDGYDHFRLRPEDFRACLKSVFGKAVVAACRVREDKPSSGQENSPAGALTATPYSGEELTIDFARTGNSSKYLVSGWSAQEENHVWSVGQASVLVLPRLDALHDWSATFDIGTLVLPPARTSQSLRIEVNGWLAGSFSLTKRETLSVRIPRDFLGRADGVRVRFLHPDCVSRKSVGAGADDRDLAICFHRLTFSSLRNSDEKPASPVS